MLDIRTVFPRVSEIANKVLPHDRLTLSFDDNDGVVVMEAASDAEFTNPGRIKLLDSAKAERVTGYAIIDDLRSSRFRLPSRPASTIGWWPPGTDRSSRSTRGRATR